VVATVAEEIEAKLLAGEVRRAAFAAHPPLSPPLTRPGFSWRGTNRGIRFYSSEIEVGAEFLADFSMSSA